MKSSCALSLNKRKRAKWLPTALSRPLERAPKSQNKLHEVHTTHRMHTCDPLAQPAITITKARPHSHDIHAAMLELGHRSAPPEHSCHRNADIALAEASSLLNTRPVTASALLSTIRLPNLATCTRLEALQDSSAAFGHQHNGQRSTACVAPATDMHMSGLATSPARLAARARTHPAHAHARSSATMKGLPPRTL